MAGKIRLFEKTTDGLLVEVHPDEADARREGRSVSHMSVVIDVLWTPAEEAAREAEEAEEAERREDERSRAAEMAADKRAHREAALQKLRGLGLSDDEIGALL